MTTRWGEPGPWAEMRARGRPPADDVVVLTDDETNGDPQVRESRPKVARDLLTPVRENYVRVNPADPRRGRRIRRAG